MKNRNFIKYFSLTLFFALFTLVSCNSLNNSPATLPTNTIFPAEFTKTNTPGNTSTATITVTPSPTTTFTTIPTKTSTQTSTSSPTVIPTFGILRGEVNVEHVSCFYGPHKSYLYKYGLLGGSNLEIIGINPETNYIEIRAIGGTNPCWMNAEWMNIKGDINTLQPINVEDLILPQSPYYGPLTGISATRIGDTVTISWNILGISPGKDSLQFPYLVEAWLCQDGELKFSPNGSWVNTISLIDQAGCEAPSHARVYGVEKHGYTSPVDVPWPSNAD